MGRISRFIPVTRMAVVRRPAADGLRWPQGPSRVDSRPLQVSGMRNFSPGYRARLGSWAKISAKKSMNTLTLLARNRPPGRTALIESLAGS